MENDFWWMDDSERELATHEFAIDKAKGKVLVGGLGLGCITEALNAKAEVTEIVVVEIAPEVIELVWEHLDVPKATIINEDLDSYLAAMTEKFDYIYMDVWKEPKDEAIPYWRGLAEKHVPSRIMLE
jgi:spermidine synthase